MIRFSKNGKLYAFTTENIAGYFPKLSLKDKRVLTVTGSGDHIINAFYLGAKDITAFDINSYANFFSELKVVCQKNLSYPQFKKFFLRRTHRKPNSDAFDFEVYKILRRSLTKQAKNFFDKRYKEFNYKGFEFRQSFYFNNKYDFNSVKLSSNLYLKNKTEYEKASRLLNLKKISFIQLPLNQLPKKIKKKFDIILLSNIADYAREFFPAKDNYLDLFYKKQIPPLFKLLNKGGKIVVAYFYDAHDIFPFRTDLDNPLVRKGVLNQDGRKLYKECLFGSVIAGKKDGISILKDGRK